MAVPGTGLLKGLAITFKELLPPAVTVPYPHGQAAPAPGLQ